VWIFLAELSVCTAIKQFDRSFLVLHNYCMTQKQLEKRIEAIEQRLDGHSKFLVNEVIEGLASVRDEMQLLVVSNDRFTELERAVADIAMVVYDRKTRRKADSRVRPH
jgi:hypothetical protein